MCSKDLRNRSKLSDQGNGSNRRHGNHEKHKPVQGRRPHPAGIGPSDGRGEHTALARCVPERDRFPERNRVRVPQRDRFPERNHVGAPQRDRLPERNHVRVPQRDRFPEGDRSPEGDRVPQRDHGPQRGLDGTS